ncbi:hypothetical protein [Paraburkholderia sp. SUR17]|jgi:hypothetical protein|uniref:hypothetical protein n=1 Tax=Paraburkholderia sp. SUR17 TaxID=3034358 RepID=UPI002407970C|nr:hypothetical protein [Paraburkholderia sp. SUR17]WEY40681.1 hypothetical protein P2869_24555 [Paraburkholderia sp. SUR17]
MLRLTLDTNAIVAIEEDRPAASAIRQLVNAHAQGRIDVALVAISASEKQRAGEIENFGIFRERLARLKLDHLSLLMPIAYFDLTFWDWSFFSNEAMIELETKIHGVLFPNKALLPPEGTPQLPCDQRPDEYWKWRNRKCDVLALWSHIYAGRDVFLTSDANFRKVTKLPALIALGAGRIEDLADAHALITDS